MVISCFVNGLAQGLERRFGDKPAFSAASVRRFVRFARFWRSDQEGR